MHKILRALALMFALQTAFADNLPAPLADTPAAGGLMHANLVVPAPRKGDSPVLAAQRQPESSPDAAGEEEQQRRDHTTGMLLAALALMAGIVVRRWGTGQQ